jgi:hypothetical protein
MIIFLTYFYDVTINPRKMKNTKNIKFKTLNKKKAKTH